VTAQLFEITVFTDPVIWTLIGGAGTVLGPVIGTALVLHFTNTISDWIVYTQIPVGILLILIVLFFPQGLVGIWRAWLARRVSP
jgi:branched-chain amino acid transport system permease protein